MPSEDLTALLRERLGRTQLGTAALFRLDTEGGGGGAADIVRSILVDEISHDPAFGQLLQAALSTARPTMPTMPAGPPSQPPPYAPARPPRPRPASGRTATVWLFGLPQFLVASIGAGLVASQDAPNSVYYLILATSLALLVTGIILGATALLRSTSRMLIAGIAVDILLLLDLFRIVATHASHT
ncbi:hypothetical protein [Kitasatospora xanthocidica]|uniref:hypothetical protein n=1 Tax=Kitasatospora xanthocidica TaxID=83382 RepID=UPI001677ED20|nr:hypothetical protein [Kitasatospora xanthocidica]